ncbi:MAG: hypothetical protein K2X47_19945, partial [Bdellovibrionales bacterium]|nr:hypothetical protein [Bdellovibrionales bacterium]
MIDTNRGVKSWGGQPQMDRGITDTVQQIGADAKQKAFGDKDIGTVLNEITDPNFVDTSKKTRGVGNTELNKDAFFKLMMAQLKNQNPLQPMESHEMAANLAQFTALEQLFNVNENLDSLKKNQEPNANYQLMSFVGKTVTADSSQIQRGKGDTIHDLKFQLPANAEEVKITVEDASGQVVRTSTQKSLKAGENKFSWNGIQDDGQTARAGDYNVKFEAKDSAGKNIAIQSRFTGRITGLNFSSQGPVLMMGNQSIRLADIKKVEEIYAATGAQPTADTPSPMIPAAANNASMQ